MLRRLSLFAAFAAALFLCACTCVVQPEKMAATYSVHKVFGDHMVLQREVPIKISGHAAAGESVLVGIANNSVFATADENGEWTAVLPAMKAGGPYAVSVSGAEGSEPIIFTDVLLGDVWLASGQSNMEMPVYSGRKFWNTTNGQEEAATSANPNIRLFNATSQKYVSPGKVQHEVKGPGWQLATPETVAPFSAVAYYFGRQLQKDLDVPIGLVSASWGGTAIQPWISRDAYEKAGRETELIRIDRIGKASDAEREAAFKAAAEKAKEAYVAWEKRFYSDGAPKTAAAADWKNTDFNDADWEKVAEPNSSFPDGVDGVAWYRKAVDLPAEWAGKELTISLGAIDDTDETYFNGVKVGAIGSDVNNFWSAKRVYKIPAELVKAGRNVVAIRVSDMFGSGGLQGNANEMFLALGKDQKIEIAKDWLLKLEFAADLKKIGNRPDPMAYMGGGTADNHPSFPATLYNSMIAPWTVYPVRGFLWYQGESNAGAPEDYLKLKQLLIEDWRAKWDNDKLPFLLVQLAGFEKHTPNSRLADDYWVNRAPGNPAWGAFRECQTATLTKVPYTGMAVCIDIGDHSDIHPANKQDIGYRLAKEAERISYGMDIISAGPYYKSMKIKGNKAVICFSNVGKGLEAKDSAEGKLNSFAIAGKDGEFVWADAVIDGDTVVVSSPKVKEPVAVRYGWVSYADNLNFYNKDGFPACPFRTDMPDYVK